MLLLPSATDYWYEEAQAYIVDGKRYNSCSAVYNASTSVTGFPSMSSPSLAPASDVRHQISSTGAVEAISAVNYDSSYCSAQGPLDVHFSLSSSRLLASTSYEKAELSCAEDRTFVSTSKSWSAMLDSKFDTDSRLLSFVSQPLLLPRADLLDSLPLLSDAPVRQVVSVSEHLCQNRWSSTIPLSSLTFLGTLGSGASGKVLLAEHPAPTPDAGTSVFAVKVLQKSTMSDFDVHDLRHEIGLLATIAREDELEEVGKHRPLGLEFVQRTFCSMQNTAHVFIVMDYHPVPLSHPDILYQLRLRWPTTPPLLSVSVSLPVAFTSSRSITLPHDEALHTLRLLSAELVLGLAFLHSRGIVHQDLKPTNVMVSSAGHAVITDLGSAKSLPLLKDPDGTCVASSSTASSVWTSSSLSRSSGDYQPRRYRSIVVLPHESVSYTPQYAAPELLGSYPRYDPDEVLEYDERVDYWSLGIMLRQLATGKPPQLDEANDAWERLSDGDTPNTAPEDQLGLAGDLAAFVAAMLAHDPDDRLNGPEVEKHPFFDPLHDLWDEIAALQHPPFPEHSLVSVDDDDTTLDLTPEDAPGGAEWKPMPGTVRRMFDEAAALSDIPWTNEYEPPVLDEDDSDYYSMVCTGSYQGDDGQGILEDGHNREALDMVRLQAPGPLHGEEDLPEKGFHEKSFPVVRSVVPSPPVTCLPTLCLSADLALPGVSDVIPPLALLCHDPSRSHLPPPDSMDAPPIVDMMMLPTLPVPAAHSLRRRSGVRNLRKVFRTSAKPHRRPAANPTVVFDVSYQAPQTLTWAFEHQITLALLTTMDYQRTVRAAIKCVSDEDAKARPASARLSLKGFFHRVKQLIRH
ncbi:kinase-like protein [Sparassis crispa]|uniref:non-specific serine/threonine protein kinase n=1 Tax=Sparassis crispa TaxID=139825 RepID=A0A401GMY4_9APHY|nr:kinase-like protein [Sparassis crispa]GBE83578.1 kinase-like protein [Sparassis crispa]